MRRQYALDSLVFLVGARIRKLRQEQRSSLRDFGKLAGVHPFHVMDIERGQVAASTTTLARIAKALGVTSGDLLNHDTENDDIGHIIEMMRKQPEQIQIIKRRVKPLVRR